MKRLSLVLCVGVIISSASLADDKKASGKPASAPSSAAAASVKDVTPQEAENILKSQKDVVVLDVRTPEEFESGHIAGAVNLDAQSDDFAEKLGRLDKNKTYLLHCAAGGRSSSALKKMRGLNFKSIYHMPGGTSAWEEAGKPLKK